MKKLFLTTILALACISGFSQAKKPTLMVVAADNWYKENNLMSTMDNLGKTEYIPMYEEGFINSSDLKTAISTVNELMRQREFPLKDMEQTLKTIKAKAAEDLASNNEAEESLLDQIKKRAKSDIVIELFWNVKPFGLRKAVHVELRGSRG